MNRYLLKDTVAIAELARRLQTCEKVQTLSREYSEEKDRAEAWTIAHSFSDLEESFRKFLDVLLPKLLKEELTGEQIEDILLEIGEEFRHILYHIKDPKFFEYLFPP